MFHGSLTVALATRRSLTRRPGLLLATLAVGALILLLPGICARAVDDSAALAFQVAVSTLLLFLSVVAGVSGLRAATADGDLGAAAEWRAADLSASAYVAGRLSGILAAALLLVCALAPFVVISQFEALRLDPPAASTLPIGLLACLATAAQFTALGLLLGAVASPQLAAVLFVATLAASRAVVPDLIARGGAGAVIAAALPDPARLDFSREIAFHRAIEAGPALLAVLAAAAQALAYASMSAFALRRREP